MDLFSSNTEEVIHKKVNVDDELTIETEEDLVNKFDLNKCLSFIKERNFSKVCLQFPDHLLPFSAQIALWLEKNLGQKVFILGDTTYKSCCTDEVAAEHVGGDAVIHMGHSCLSPSLRIPVLHVLPKADLDLARFVNTFTTHCAQSSGSVLLLYDVAFCHLEDEIRGGLSELGQRVVVSRLCVPDSEGRPCGVSCHLHQGSDTHATSLLGRAFCCQSPTSLVYIHHKHSQNMLNFAMSFRDIPMFMYADGEMKDVDSSKALRRRLYLMERLKDAKTIGIVVGSLSIDKFLDIIEYLKKLASYHGKRSYVFSVGKPNPAKLANFPEIEIFVLVSCPEACVENEKEYMQPVVTIVEAELALNVNRKWDDLLSVDFRDFLTGTAQNKPSPEAFEAMAADVSLISNRIRSNAETTDSEASTQLSVRQQYQISVTNSYSAERSWRGLDPALGETPVSQAAVGRSGIPLGYNNEK